FGALRSSDTERVERNLSRVREVFASLPSPALADLIVLLHDIGKLGRAGEENLGPSWPHNHEKNSSSLIEKFDLLKDFAGEGSVIKTEEDRVAVELVLRHHHLIGNCFQGAASPELFIELISDPAFVAMVKSKEDPKKSPADSAKERVAFANKVLDWMLFFTIVDVAGQGETGYLSNLRLEYYFSIRDKIGDILKEELGKGTLNGWGAEAAQKIQEFAAAEGPNRLAAVTSPIEGAGLMDTHVQGLDYYGKGWVAPSVEAAISSGAISRDDWKTVIEVFQRMVFPYFDGYLLGGNPAHRLDDVDAAIAHKPAAKVNGNLLKYYALCAQVVKMVNLDKPVEFIMIDKDGNPTTGGAKKVEAATRQTTDGQQAFIDGLNNLFGLDGQGVPTQVTAQGEVEFPLYHRGVKRGNLYTAQGVEGQIDFLVDAKTTRLNAARVVVYVRLPELELTMPGEPK
ncbi:MAG: hypothetical protein NT099_03470, partial [Candidatus Saganbacteria bacterium]|nr:hypothetical protein [Candidatus Saganbacteria bacterium]